MISVSDEKSHHQRLLLLHEAGGRIEGRAKYHKLLFKYQQDKEEAPLTFVREERGPYDPGLSEAMQRYSDLGLVKVDDSDEPHEVIETEKGQRYMSGYERTKTRLDDAFARTREKVEEVVRHHGDRSANDIVEDEDVQEAKDNPFWKKLE